MQCADAILFGVYPPNDNVGTLVLVADGAVLDDLSAVTRVTVDLDGGATVIDSSVVGSSVIWWSDSITYRGKVVEVLRLRLGGQVIAAGTYEDVAIRLFSAGYPNGLRIENDVQITVHA